MEGPSDGVGERFRPPPHVFRILVVQSGVRYAPRILPIFAQFLRNGGSLPASAGIYKNRDVFIRIDFVSPIVFVYELAQPLHLLVDSHRPLGAVAERDDEVLHVDEPAADVTVVVLEHLGDEHRGVVDLGCWVVRYHVLVLPASPPELRSDVLLVLRDVRPGHDAVLEVESVEYVVVFPVAGDFVFPALPVYLVLRKQRLHRDAVDRRVERDLAVQVGDEVLVVADEHLLRALPVLFPKKGVRVGCRPDVQPEVRDFLRVDVRVVRSPGLEVGALRDERLGGVEEVLGDRAGLVVDVDVASLPPDGLRGPGDRLYEGMVRKVAPIPFLVVVGEAVGVGFRLRDLIPEHGVVADEGLDGVLGDVLHRLERLVRLPRPA